MSAPNTNNPTHNAAQSLAEGVRQAEVAAATTQAQVNAAAIKFNRAVVRSGLANGVGVEPAMTALRALGVTGL